jgi:hypothetical protein
MAETFFSSLVMHFKRVMMKRIKSRATAALLVSLAISACSKLPEYHAVDETHWLDQNWSPSMWNQFYHVAQGTEIMPYKWFLALEQPVIELGEVPLLKETSNLGRYGFLPDAANASNNPDGLPVGFVKDTAFKNPYSGKQQTMLGFTCATCHTGQLNITTSEQLKVGLRIDGGPAMIDLQTFETDLAKALILTDKIPFRFERFSKRVLGEDYTADASENLHKELKAFLKTGFRELKLNTLKKIYPHAPGFGRVDALNRINNQVFGLQLDEDNMHTADAPVAYPHIWETSWFSHVQYNGSVPNPLLRNIGESLGVKTPIVLTGDASNWYQTASHIDNLVALEQWLAGKAPYEGLTAPHWPEQYLGKIDQTKAQAGKVLYTQHCASCHLPPKAELMQDLSAEQPRFWTKQNTLGQRLLDTPMVPLDQIGTDPNQANGFVDRTVDTKDLGLGKLNAGVALDTVTRLVAQRYFKENNIPPDQQIMMGNGHEVGSEPPVAERHYKARPLAGVWATPPFLHNGSIPTLYALLSPLSERPEKFYLGTHEYDAVRVGYLSTELSGGYVFDTSKSGNHNTGHVFDDNHDKGTIGPKLTEAQRWQLLEYLKTL